MGKTCRVPSLTGAAAVIAAATRIATLTSRKAAQPGGITMPRLARQREDAWNRTTQVPYPAATFSSRELDGLPEPLCRWLSRSIPDGTPLWSSVVMELDGEIKLRGWCPYTSTLALCPPNRRLWTARAIMNGLPIMGFDRYTDNDGEMLWRLLGLFPVVKAHDEKVARSASTVPGLELAWCPTAYRQFDWAQTGQDTVEGRWESAFGPAAITLVISPEGDVVKSFGTRWGEVNGPGTYQKGTFVGLVDETAEFDGVRIMTRIRGGWGTPEGELTGEFLRGEVRQVTWR